MTSTHESSSQPTDAYRPCTRASFHHRSLRIAQGLRTLREQAQLPLTRLPETVTRKEETNLAASLVLSNKFAA